jgi:hypothetical protein
MLGGFPSSANACTSSAQPVAPSGFHDTARATSVTCSTPLRITPAAARLSLATTSGALATLAAGGHGTLTRPLVSAAPR